MLEAPIDLRDMEDSFANNNDTELATEVERYAQTYPGLEEHAKLFKCGAYLQKNKLTALLLPELEHLSPEAKYYLGANDENNPNKFVREVDEGFWGQSKYLKGSILSACLAGIIQ